MQTPEALPKFPGRMARLRAHIRRRKHLSGWRDLAAESVICVANKFGRSYFYARFALPLRPKGFRRGVLVRPCTTDLAAFADVFCKGEYTEAIGCLGAGTRRILDLGGNVGFSVRLWQQMFPDARVLVVEPDEENLRQLRRNVLRGPSPQNVEIKAGFAGASAGLAGIDRSGGEYAYKISVAAPDGERIVVHAVSDLVEQLAGPGGRIDLLKCDIEGAEASVFANCAAWISRLDVLVVETHLPYTPSGLTADIERAGIRHEYIGVDEKPDGYAVVTVALGRPRIPAGPQRGAE